MNMLTPPTTPHRYNLTLLRHGESIGNAEGKHQGQADFPLTEQGKAQARALAERWLSEKTTFDLIISSPLARARGTAQILADALQIPLEFNPLWMERDNGKLAGLRPEEATVTYPQPAFIHPYLPIGQTGESQWELYLRAGNAIQGLLHHAPGNYLIVSHGGILNMVLYAILGITPQANFYGPRFRFGNTAFATLSYKPDEHKWYVHGINDQAHLQSSE
jgi:2,3-bisphosphoglycerate-dependent phosphoglycerate mutase